MILWMQEIKVKDKLNMTDLLITKCLFSLFFLFAIGSSYFLYHYIAINYMLIDLLLNIIQI